MRVSVAPILSPGLTPDIGISSLGGKFPDIGTLQLPNAPRLRRTRRTNALPLGSSPLNTVSVFAIHWLCLYKQIRQALNLKNSQRLFNSTYKPICDEMLILPIRSLCLDFKSETTCVPKRRPGIAPGLTRHANALQLPGSKGRCWN